MLLQINSYGLLGNDADLVVLVRNRITGVRHVGTNRLLGVAVCIICSSATARILSLLAHSSVVAPIAWISFVLLFGSR